MRGVRSPKMRIALGATGSGRLPRAAADIDVPSPLVGEGCSALQRNGLGDGEFATPHPTECVNRQALPSPARGEGTVTSARVCDAILLRARSNGAARFSPRAAGNAACGAPVFR